MRDRDGLLQWLVETQAEFQDSVVDNALDQWRKRLKACVYAVTLLAWHSSCHTSQPALKNRLFSEPPTFGGKQYTFYKTSKFCISQRSVVTFADVVGKFTVTVTVHFILR